MPVKVINERQTMQMLNSGKFDLVIDLRSYDEYIDKHLPGAINIPVNEILDRINEIKKYQLKNVLLYCEHGIKSVSAGKVLILNGFKSVYSLDKGFN